MKVIVKKEFDGKNFVGICENLPNCYSQSYDPEKVVINLRKAIEIYHKSYLDRNQVLPDKYDSPVINKKIRFDTVTTKQILNILSKNQYHIEHSDLKSVLLINNVFPFNRIHLPVVDDLSPLIVARVFGIHNIIYVGQKRFNVSSTA